MLAEFDKLKIKSDTLNGRIALLAQPVTKLTDEELALLRQPVISISDEKVRTRLRPALLTLRLHRNSRANRLWRRRIMQPRKANLQNGFKPNVPTDLIDVSKQAKENFDQGKYHAGEREYQELLTKSPNNLYSLSNLGVFYSCDGQAEGG